MARALTAGLRTPAVVGSICLLAVFQVEAGCWSPAHDEDASKVAIKVAAESSITVINAQNIVLKSTFLPYSLHWAEKTTDFGHYEA